MKALLAVLAVLAALAGLVVGGERLEPAPPPRPVTAAERVPVQGASVLCPRLVSDGESVASRVSVGAPSATPSPGAVTTAVVGADDAPSPTALTAPGSAVTGLGTTVADAPLEVAATGSLAAGLEVEQLIRGDSGATRGLAGQQCRAPGVEHWFLGGSTGEGRSTTMVLANAEAQDATVDVQLWGAEGPLDADPGRGLVVPARGRLLVPLNALAPDQATLAARVTAGRGRVSAAVLVAQVRGRLSRGIEAVPQAVPPAGALTVAPLPRGPGARSLLLANPGTAPTTASVELSGRDGQQFPPELQAVPVPAGTVVGVDLTALLAGGEAALTVTAQSPLLATGYAGTAGTGTAEDLSYVGSAEPLDGPAVLTDVGVDAATSSTLLLSAVDGDAAVQVSPLPVGGSTASLRPPVTVEVPGGSTRTLDLVGLVDGGAGRLAVEVRPLPGSGPVHASRYLVEDGRTGPLATALVLRSAPTQVPRPQVQADPLAGRRD